MVTTSGALSRDQDSRRAPMLTTSIAQSRPARLSVVTGLGKTDWGWPDRCHTLTSMTPSTMLIPRNRVQTRAMQILFVGGNVSPIGYTSMMMHPRMARPSWLGMEWIIRASSLYRTMHIPARTASKRLVHVVALMTVMKDSG